MYVLLSPSKTLDLKQPVPAFEPTKPVFEAEVGQLVALMQKMSVAEIQKLMDLSDALAALNHKRFQDFRLPLTSQNSRPALFTFKGDVYDKMDVHSYTASELAFANKHVGILSGLYGLLRVMDMMQPYRLEMGRPVATAKGKTLYAFWAEKITEEINKRSNGLVVNLASQEYFAAVQPEKLTGRLLHIDLKQYKNGQLKTIGLMAKRARGLMADYIIKNHITDADKLMQFNAGGYAFAPELSDPNRWVFTTVMDK